MRSRRLYSLLAVLVLVVIASGCPGGGNPIEECCDATGEADPANMPPPANGANVVGLMRPERPPTPGTLTITAHTYAADDDSSCVRAPCFNRLLSKAFVEVTTTVDQNYAYSFQLTENFLDPAQRVVLRARGADVDGTEVEGFLLPVQMPDPDIPTLLPPFDYQSTAEGIAERQALYDWAHLDTINPINDGPPDRGLVRRAVKPIPSPADAADSPIDFTNPSQMNGWGFATLTSQYARYRAYETWWNSPLNTSDPNVPFVDAWAQLKDESRQLIENVDSAQVPVDFSNDDQFEDLRIAVLDDGFPGGGTGIERWRASCTQAMVETAAVYAFNAGKPSGIIDNQPPAVYLDSLQYARILRIQAEALQSGRSILDSGLGDPVPMDNIIQRFGDAENAIAAIIAAEGTAGGVTNGIFDALANDTMTDPTNMVDIINRLAIGGQGNTGQVYLAYFDGSQSDPPSQTAAAKINLQNTFASGTADPDEISSAVFAYFATADNEITALLEANGLEPLEARFAACVGVLLTINAPNFTN